MHEPSVDILILVVRVPAITTGGLIPSSCFQVFQTSTLPLPSLTAAIGSPRAPLRKEVAVAS
jgi:hypothetical protein